MIAPDRGCYQPGCTNSTNMSAVIREADGSTTYTRYCAAHSAAIYDAYVKATQGTLFPPSADVPMEECEFQCVASFHEQDRRFLLLSSMRSKRFFLASLTGHQAENATLAAQYGSGDARLTHQMLLQLVEKLGATCREAAIYGFELHRGRYKCRLVVTRGEEPIEVECEVSDAVATALTAKVPLRVSEAFLFKPPGVR